MSFSSSSSSVFRLSGGGFRRHLSRQFSTNFLVSASASNVKALAVPNDCSINNFISSSSSCFSSPLSVYSPISIIPTSSSRPPPSPLLSLPLPLLSGQRRNVNSFFILSCARFSTNSSSSSSCPSSSEVAEDMIHFRGDKKKDHVDENNMPHPVWSTEELRKIEIIHVKPEIFSDRFALMFVKTVRGIFDFFTGYHRKTRTGKMRSKDWITRLIFLESIAGVPGMVGAMIRHLHSLRRMKRDYGWIHTLLEEAENERMHLLTALLLRNPGWFCRAVVLIGQGVFFWSYSFTYLVAPSYCHRFVGYLEEEAVKTYTKLVADIDAGLLPEFDVIAHPSARAYYQLPDDSKLREVFLCMRADEAHHREVNHVFAKMREDDVNPFPPGH